MPLKVELRPSQTEFVYQESPDLGFSLVNDGSQALSVTHPGRTPNPPVARLVDVASGEVLVLRSPAPVIPPEAEALEPGARIDWSVPLDECCSLPGPGTYDLSLLYPFDGDQEAESAPVRLRALPSTAEALALASVRGAPGPELNAAWVNGASEPPRLLRGSVSLTGEQPRLGEVRTLVPIAAEAEPCISAPPNGQVSRDHWVAWLDGARLRAVHFSEQGGASAPLELTLASAEALLVGPLHAEPLEDPAERPSGAALLWLPEGGGRWLEVGLRESGLSAGAGVEAPGPRPLWARSFTRSGGARWVASLQQEDGRLVLRAGPWPGGAEEARSLAEWSGDLLGAAAALDTRDAIQGAVLLGPEEGADEASLELIRWSLDPAGEWKELGRDSLAWESDTEPGWAHMEISAAAAVAVVVRDRAGAHFVYRSGGPLRPASATLGESYLPLAVAFQSDYDPLLIATEPERGLRILRLDGTPLAADPAGGDPSIGFGAP